MRIKKDVFSPFLYARGGEKLRYIEITKAWCSSSVANPQLIYLKDRETG